MDLGFSFYLTLAVVVSGAVSLWHRCHGRHRAEKNAVIDYLRAAFPILLIVWVMRSFILQPYRVPTGSLEPTVMPGDFIAVEQFAYGLRLPVLNKKIINIREPKRGDIALFRWPVDPEIIFVKRVIGLPGDHVVYKNKVLYINGVKMAQQFLYHANDVGSSGYRRAVAVKQENLMGVVHAIYVEPRADKQVSYNRVIPSGHYFMMGDNRDNSDDSRRWGFVPEQNLIGKAVGVWMSWDVVQHHVRWHRVGKAL